jgi:hypothetical protein
MAKPLEGAKPSDGPPSDKKSASGSHPSIKIGAPSPSGIKLPKPPGRPVSKSASGSMPAINVTAKSPSSSSKTPASGIRKAGLSGAMPVPKGVRTLSIPAWMWIAGGVASVALLIGIAAAIILLSGGPPAPVPRGRDTSSLFTGAKAHAVCKHHGAHRSPSDRLAESTTARADSTGSGNARF